LGKFLAGMAPVTDALGVRGETGTGYLLKVVDMNHQRFQGAPIHTITVVEHPALLVGVTKVLEPGNLGLFLGTVAAEEGEKLGLVVKIGRGDSNLSPAFLNELEIVALILRSPTRVTGTKDQPDDFIPRFQIFF
jgi:hypothetical protein